MGNLLRYGMACVSETPSVDGRPPIVLADSSARSVRDWSRALERQYSVRRIAGSSRRLIPVIRRSRPDAVVIGVPRASECETVVRQLRSIFPQLKIVALANREMASAARVLAAGADAVVDKQSEARHLVAALEQVSSSDGNTGSRPDAERGKARRSRPPRSPEKQLTDRQSEVLILAAAGYPHRVIAERLHVSIKTVEYHKAQIKRKLYPRPIA